MQPQKRFATVIQTNKPRMGNLDSPVVNLGSQGFCAINAAQSVTSLQLRQWVFSEHKHWGGLACHWLAGA
jgi:hypothetical protein